MYLLLNEMLTFECVCDAGTLPGRRRDEEHGQSAGQLPLHDWLHSNVTHCRQGSGAGGYPLLSSRKLWFGFALFQNESLAANWIKSTLCFSSGIPECAGTRQTGGNENTEKSLLRIFLNRDFRPAVNKCRLFWRVWFCAPEASCHPWLCLPGCDLRASPKGPWAPFHWE